jgi:hypothetical protein
MKYIQERDVAVQWLIHDFRPLQRDMTAVFNLVHNIQLLILNLLLNTGI